MESTVLPSQARSKASNILRSVSLSRLAVISSNSRISGEAATARAMESS